MPVKLYAKVNADIIKAMIINILSVKPYLLFIETTSLCSSFFIKYSAYFITSKNNSIKNHSIHNEQ